jgi:hypothetical protein
VVTRKNNSDTAVASASWNGNTTVPTLTNVNTYEIYYNNKRVYFVINGILMHTVTATTATWSDTKTFPIRMENTNTGVGTVETLEAWTATIVRLGKLETKPQYKHISGASATYVLKYSSGHLHKVIFNNTTGASLTVYDATAATGGTEIAIITTTTSCIGAWDYECPFFNGLTVKSSGDAGLDATIVYE